VQLLQKALQKQGVGVPPLFVTSNQLKPLEVKASVYLDADCGDAYVKCICNSIQETIAHWIPSIDL